MQLSIPGFSFADLLNPDRLADLSALFLRELAERDPALAARRDAYRVGATLNETEVSQILVDLAPHVSSFLSRLFGVDSELRAIRLRAERDSVIFRVKKDFMVRRVIKKFSADQTTALDEHVIEQQTRAVLDALEGIPRGEPELELAAGIWTLLEHEMYVKVDLPPATRSALVALASRLRKSAGFSAIVPVDETEGELKRFLTSLTGLFEQRLALFYHHPTESVSAWGLLRVPHRIEYTHLVETVESAMPVPGTHVGHEDHMRRRIGFDLTDARFALREVESEVDYCIICHERKKDSCSKGFHANGSYQKNPLGYTLKGCPLDQKISESHLLMGRGDPLGALAIIMVDNPMLPGTGHRICNDCMKACIYQKQDPVNIPQIETRILTEILDLPYGFEIYSLLTRWNPLNISRPFALPYNGMNILIVGLGPAGYTLAHYFLNEGFGVVGIEGLKVEPLPRDLVGDEAAPPVPVKDFASIRKNLGSRVLAGFGGVSEYGITVRWDKNFLTVIYLNLLRWRNFRLYDGVRFGGTLKVENAWEYGFEHVCFATGAGKPTFVSMKNNLIRGIRKASDFLMALQLTGAAKTDSMANLQIRLPALVIGGGLTAIDTATELMAYYPVQVTKIKRRYDILVNSYGEENVRKMFDAEELGVLSEFLAHAEALEQERRRAADAGETPNFAPLVRSWGGVHIYYRKSLLDSPAYRLNHEEIIKSLEEGISFVECMSPVEAVPDANGALSAMVFERLKSVNGKWSSTGETFRVPARALLVAAGTVSNVMYENEHPGTFAMDEKREFFRSHSYSDAGETHIGPAVKGDAGFFTSYEREGKYVSYYGDNHPDYAGNVVKAMASAKHGHRAVLGLLEEELRAARSVRSDEKLWKQLTAHLDAELRPTVVAVHRLTPTIIEVIVHAPRAAREFRPGQFYRLQDYEMDAAHVGETLVMMEGIALTGAWTDKEKGEIGLIALEVGASSRLCALLRPGQRVVVMGPTGHPTEITPDGTALLLGGGLGNAVLFSIAKAFKEKGNKVLYFAGYKKKEDLFKQEDIEAATDAVIYSVDAGEPIEPRRPSDRSFVGNIIQAMLAYAEGKLGAVQVPMSDAGRIIAIGSDRMMSAVAKARHDVLRPHLRNDHVAVASINSPMQCMMKAVCAQCLQRHVNPLTGEEEFVFTCVNQDQLMDEVDFDNLHSRLKANSVMEKISNRWLDHLLRDHTSSLTSRP